MLWLLLLIPIGLLLYWELIIAEGAHLGPRVVVWLYDLVAPRYDDRIKKFSLAVEDDFLGLPLVAKLVELDAPRVLDVAAGTGRAARALLRQTAFDGSIVNLELSAGMMRAGQDTLTAWPGRASWLRGPADRLPFPDNTFDMVTCLEALEFLPDARAALAEGVRVLRPGGWLVTTNRIGLAARLIAGKTFSRPKFKNLLAEYPLEELRVHPWQVEYDLAWGKKTVNWATGQ